MPGGDEQLGEELVLETGRVRVWKDQVRPGEAQRLHTHRRPYLAVVVSGSTVRTEDEEGNVLSAPAFRPGDVHYFDESVLPITHTMRNTGTDDVEVVIIELL